MSKLIITGEQEVFIQSSGQMPADENILLPPACLWESAGPQLFNTWLKHER